MNTTRTVTLGLAALLGALSLSSAARAQSRDDGDVRQTVARVAYLSGDVSYSRGDDPDDWQPASLNYPMTLGDRLYAARGARLEVQTEGSTIYLAPESDLAALNLTRDVKQFSLGMGSASFRIERLGSDEAFEVDTPNAAITIDRRGSYRIDVDRDGNTRILVRAGHAWVAAAGAEAPVESGSMMTIDGVESATYDVVSLPEVDAWDRWVGLRSRRARENRSHRYASADISGLEDLDEHGSWSEIPEYGTCWSPNGMPGGWQPYRAGRWAWQDPWGWNWVSTEPWGWAPYHYGRWVTSRARWYWVPVRPDVRAVRYSPALVAFVGGPGLTLSASLAGGGFVGWFPLAPRDPFVPWWGPRARETNFTPATNARYENRAHLTVVSRTSFVSGGMVARNTVRDARVLREISAAPVVRGFLPIAPVAASIRVSGRPGSGLRPPAVALSRPVVTRRAPAPAPVGFREKVDVIRENRGLPVDGEQALGLAPTPRGIRPSRPVAVESGRSSLTPKRAEGSRPTPAPLTRSAATSQAVAPDDGRSAENDAHSRDADRRRGEVALRQQEAAGTPKRQDDDAVRGRETEGPRAHPNGPDGDRAKRNDERKKKGQERDGKEAPERKEKD